MKVLFLDINGVMIPSRQPDFNQDCFAQLRRITEETRCRIVLSSSLRALPTEIARIEKHLKGNSILPLIGKTPSGQKRTRMNVILEWINYWDSNFVHHNQESLKLETCIFEEAIGEHEKTKITHWVALDDIENLENSESKGHVVQTKSHQGLTEERANKAIQILNSN